MEQHKIEYNCECCNYNCVFLSHWHQHCSSYKHKNNGIKKIRSDKQLNPICDLCGYFSNNLTNMKTHQLTKHSSNVDRKNKFTFYCDLCDFGTFTNILFKRHVETVKHKNKEVTVIVC